MFTLNPMRPMAKSLRVLAALLGYPDVQMRGYLPEMRELLHAESALAPVHMLAKPAAFTLSTFQLATFWLKAVAPLNMLAMVVTPEVFHLPMSWLKAVAPTNMLTIVATLAVFHEPMLPLKAVALWNMVPMCVTLAVFHEPTLTLKAFAR